MPAAENRGSLHIHTPYQHGTSALLQQVAQSQPLLLPQALHHYKGVSGPHQAQAADVYRQLRANLLGNIVRQYGATGFLWENYDDSDGHGRGSHPFTGWTALFVLVAGEAYE